MAHDPAKLRERAEAAAPPEMELRFKPMFGGIGVYADGRMFMTLSNCGLALKLGGTEREKLLALPGAKPLQYAPDAPPSRSYVVVPDSVLANRERLRSWIKTGAAFVKSAEPRLKKRR